MRGGRERAGRRVEDRSCPFLKTGKKFPDFEEKSPDYGHLLVKFF